jgi:hypothetical protein
MKSVGVCYWHETDVPRATTDVYFRGYNGSLIPGPSGPELTQAV